jgi:hypothetical protein
MGNNGSAEDQLVVEFRRYLDDTEGKSHEFRVEALHAGFRLCWQERDYSTIVKVAEKLPDAVLQEDEKLLIYYENALARLGDE